MGIAQNAAGYALYLCLVWAGLSPQGSIAICYPVCLLFSYLGNKKYSFQFSSHNHAAFYRFLLVHLVSYLYNIAFLYVTVDIYGQPHELMQLINIFISAVFIFVALKVFVFRANALAD